MNIIHAHVDGLDLITPCRSYFAGHCQTHSHKLSLCFPNLCSDVNQHTNTFKFVCSARRVYKWKRVWIVVSTNFEWILTIVLIVSHFEVTSGGGAVRSIGSTDYHFISMSTNAKIWSQQQSQLPQSMLYVLIMAHTIQSIK